MHELGIAQDLWSAIQRHAHANNLARITRIVIIVGEASGIEMDFLRHSLKDHILPHTLAAGAELRFINVPLRARCNGCSAEITKESMILPACPHCGSGDLEIISGKETYVETIEGE